MTRKPYTGGPLNALNGRAGISAPGNSVSVSGLIKAHGPRSAAELERLIAEHVPGNCACGIISQGSIQDFGRNLFAAQKEHWGEYRFSLTECIQWEYDLFVLQMLKGNMMEDKCKQALAANLSDQFQVCYASKYVDEEMRVDLEVLFNGDAIAGIQVKPESFNKVRPGIKTFNERANVNYGKPVFYATYNYETELFNEMSLLVERIRKIASARGLNYDKRVDTKTSHK